MAELPLNNLISSYFVRNTQADAPLASLHGAPPAMLRKALPSRFSVATRVATRQEKVAIFVSLWKTSPSPFLLK